MKQTQIKRLLTYKQRITVGFLLCCIAPTLVQSASAIEPFSAAGDFVFHTVPSDNNPTCFLTPNPTFSLIMYACIATSQDCTDDDKFVRSDANQSPEIELAGNASYHFSPDTIRALSNKYKTSTGVYPTRIQIAQLYCSGAARATLSNDGMYTASCTNQGCIATSAPITVTFPN